MTYRVGDPIKAFRITAFPLRVLHAVVLLAVRIVDRFVFGLRVQGREELGRTPRAMLVSNHTLLLDPGVIAHSIAPRRTYFTMLEETARVPYLGTFVRLLGAIPIPVRRGAAALLGRAFREAVDEVGYIHVFPEGECYHWSQEVRPLHRGPFVLALRAGLPVIPVTTVLHERAALRAAPA